MPNRTLLIFISALAVASWVVLATDAGEAAESRYVYDFALSQPGVEDRIIAELGLQDDEISNLRKIVQDEMVASEEARWAVPDGPTAGAVQRYNRRVAAIMNEANIALQGLLGPDRFARFEEIVRWSQRVPAVIPLSTADGVTYRVWATQFEPNAGTPAEQVALPDKCVKFASLASLGEQWARSALNQFCGSVQEGYPVGSYRVRIVAYDRNGNPKTAPYETGVYDVGPYNEDDNYWNAADASLRPRRLFKDLPRGVPETQAAKESGYNGGLDQFGRTVVQPAGIDLSVQLARQLGLHNEQDAQGNWINMENAWVDVTFLWESGEVWPGDANMDGRVDETDALAVAGYFGAGGPARTGASTNWRPEPVDVDGWPSQEAANADTDGNGQVDANDLAAVHSNWGREHAQ